MGWIPLFRSLDHQPTLPLDVGSTRTMFDTLYHMSTSLVSWAFDVDFAWLMFWLFSDGVMTIPRSRVNRTTLIRQLFTGLLRVSGLPEGDVDKPSDLLPCLRVRSPPPWYQHALPAKTSVSFCATQNYRRSWHSAVVFGLFSPKHGNVGMVTTNTRHCWLTSLAAGAYIRCCRAVTSWIFSEG